jgi:hypothetical protein
MPGSRSARRIPYPITSCEGEKNLDDACGASAGFRADLRIIRSSVANGSFSPQHGVDTLKVESGIDFDQSLLINCLSKIAAGTCPNYPLYTTVSSQAAVE